jgi:hypothetical protein
MDLSILLPVCSGFKARIDDRRARRTIHAFTPNLPELFPRGIAVRRTFIGLVD